MSGANIPLEKNKNSRILDLLKDIPYSSRYNDEDKENQPNNYPVVSTIFPKNYIKPVAQFNGETFFDFPLPEDQFFRNALIKTSLTCEGDNSGLRKEFGIFIFSKIYLMQDSRIIQECNPSYLLSRISDLPQQSQQYYNSIISNMNFNNTTITIYTPLFWFFIDNESDNLLLDFHKNMYIRCVWSNLTFDSPLTGFDTSLLCYRRCFNEDYKSSFISNRYKSSSGHTNLFPYCIRTLTNTVVNGTTTTRTLIQLPILCTSIHAAILYSDNNSLNIESIQIFNGVIEVLPQLTRAENLLNSIGFSNNKYDLIPGNVGSTEFSYYFGSKNRQGFNAGIDLSEEAGPYYIIYTHTEATAEAILHINFEYTTILQCQNSSGYLYSSLIH